MSVHMGWHGNCNEGTVFISPMKNLLPGFILLTLCAGCLTAPTPKSDPVETAVSRQLTREVTSKPTLLPLPAVWTLPPPAVNTPTRMATEPPAPTGVPFTLGPAPTWIGNKTATLDPNSDVRSITYSMTGTAGEVEITYVKPDGTVESGTIPLPFETVMVFKKGAPLSLFGRVLSDTGTINCQVTSADKTLIQATASGNKKMAFCSDIVAE